MAEHGLRVLAVCDAPPAVDSPRSDGNTLISHHVLTRLTQLCRLSLLWFERPGLLPCGELLAACEASDSLPVPTGPWPSLRGNLSRYPASAERRSTRSAVHRFEQMAQEVDVVYLHGPSSLLLARGSQRPVVANEIDPMSLSLLGQGRRASGVRRAEAFVRAGKSRALERRVSRTVDQLLLVNEEDAIDLGRVLSREVVAVPNGVQPGQPADEPTTDRNRICFVGAFDYGPNLDSATVLVREVLPLVRQQLPDAHLVLAGRSATAEVRALAGEGVRILEDVPDVMEVFRSSAVAAFPGGYGRGTRNSVFQALRAGRPVVSSTVSARGVGRGDHLILVDDAASMAAAVLGLLTDPEDYDRAERAAARYGAGLPTWDAVALTYLRLLNKAAQSEISIR